MLWATYALSLAKQQRSFGPHAWLGINHAHFKGKQIDVAWHINKRPPLINVKEENMHRKLNKMYKYDDTQKETRNKKKAKQN